MSHRVSKKRLGALKTKERTELLTGSIRKHLLPVFTKQGFEVAPPVHRGPVDREFVLSFPAWGRLIRAREAGVDLIEIQFALYRRAAFRINAGVAPKNGMMPLTGHWLAEDVLVHWLKEFFEMYAAPRWRTWFSVRRWLYRSPTQGNYDKLALQVAGFVPELDLALREGKLGPHMRRVVIPRPVSLIKVKADPKLNVVLGEGRGPLFAQARLLPNGGTASPPKRDSRVSQVWKWKIRGLATDLRGRQDPGPLDPLDPTRSPD